MLADALALPAHPLLNIVASLDELTRYDTKLHLNLIAMNNIRAHYEDRKLENETLSEMHKLKAWEKARIKDLMRRVDQLVLEDAPQLVNILKTSWEGHGEQPVGVFSWVYRPKLIRS